MEPNKESVLDKTISIEEKVESDRKSSLTIVNESMKNSYEKVESSTEKMPTDNNAFDALYKAIENSDQELARYWINTFYYYIC